MRSELQPERRTETMGTNLPHQEVKVVDLQMGATLPVGEAKWERFAFGVTTSCAGITAIRRRSPRLWIARASCIRIDLGSMDGEGYPRRIKESPRGNCVDFMLV